MLAAIKEGRDSIGEAASSRLGDPVGIIRSRIPPGVELVGRAALPYAIRDLPDCPDLLFAKGKLPDGAAVAVVGSRRSSAYGRRVARAIGRALALAGWPVVSGLARGVDGEAHKGVVEAGGVGVAVLGSGIDVIYPPEHARLAQELVAAGGALVSEAPPGVPPAAWRFPPRNRIISGLAAAVVVVEAAVNSGALITAARALEQGRTVLALPGDIDRPTSEGCNLLIRDGAHPVLGVDDLLDSLGIDLGVAPRALGPDPVLDALMLPMAPGELSARLGWPVPQTLVALGKLEARGLVTSQDGLFIRVEREN